MEAVLIILLWMGLAFAAWYYWLVPMLTPAPQKPIGVQIAEELADHHVVRVDEALQLVQWSQRHYGNNWNVYAAAMAELADQGLRVDDMLQWETSDFESWCRVCGVWFPSEIDSEWRIQFRVPENVENMPEILKLALDNWGDDDDGTV